jgi:fructose-1,6-bisphosphatase/inositol monophosphatase family enzyme
MIRNAPALLARLRTIQAHIRDTVVAETERSAIESLAAAVGDDAGDTIFAIDRVSEEALLAQFEDLAREWPLRLVAEGLGETGVRELGAGAPEIVVIVDPIDGTRGLMYQKRPAWVLTGVAPADERPARLSDIELAVQTEIPLVKQHLSDSLWALGDAVGGERYNRLNGERRPLRPMPTRAVGIEQGFGNIARFFPGTRGLLAEIDDALVARLLGEPPPGRAQAFEDQYISSGGQLYELLMGHDRWCADLRPLIWRRKGVRGLCCHPYDLCTERIARAAGIHVTDEHGQPLSAPLDVDSDVTWIGYANGAIHGQVAPVLAQLLGEHALLA